MWVKICGVTTPTDAKMVATSGADAVGLNFYAKSKRYVSQETAAQLRKEVGDSLEVVGVFVNSSADEVASIAQHVGLTAVQFHGDESVDTLLRFQEALPDVDIIRAFRIGADGPKVMLQQVREINDADVRLKAVLVDAYVPGQYGGTGHQVRADWLADSSP